MPELEQKEPALLFFYEMMPGDVLKYQTKSNKAKSGGGARDLRPRPADGFARVLRPMFPETVEEGVSKGTIHWVDDEDNDLSTDICLWRPTAARPGEARIATSYKVGKWRVSEEDYNEAVKNDKKRFYVLLMDRDRVTWAYVMNEEQLEHWNLQVRDYVRERIALTRKGTHVAGSINFETGETYPNARI